MAANLEISLGALLGIIAGVTAALVGTGVLIYLNSSYKKLKDLNKELKNTEGALSTVQDNYKELLSDLDSYDEMMADLNQLVAGSNDWKDRLVEVNKQVDELLKKYPILADYTTEENGLTTISSEGIELIKEQQREQIDNLIKKEHQLNIVLM